MSERLDFRALFEAAPGCFLVLATDFTILAASDAYLRATKTERSAIVGRGLFDVFPDNPDDPRADGVTNLSASLGRAIARKQPDRMPVQKYDIRLPAAEGGGFVERHWQPLNVPVLGAEGRVACIVHSVEDVTERVILERQRVRSEDQYRQLLDTSPDAIVVVDRAGRIQLVNIETESMFGYTRAELLGQPLSLLVPDRFRGRHAAHEAQFFARPTPRPMGSRLDLHARKKDGTEIPIEVRLSPLGSGESMTVSAAIRDVSERKRMEAEAKVISDRLASAVESIQDAFAVFDERDRLILCNSTYRRLFAHALPGPLVGRPFTDVIGALAHEYQFVDDDARARWTQEHVAARRAFETSTFDARTRDGRRLRVMDRATAEGGTVTTIWDLTQEERTAEELRSARAAAESGSAAKSEFLSSMSHELRTPLNAILGFAQLLQRDRKEPLSARHKERVEQILRGGEHLLRLIDDVLDLSRIEARGVSVSIEPVSVREVLDEVFVALDSMAARTGVRIALDPLPEELPMIAADRTRFAQILMNLGSNAIKYNRPEGAVRFAVSAHGERIRVAVRDTGMGVPLDKQDKLFQPFQRAGQETGPIEGTGIGLVITQRLARLMGGETGFESTPGEGSTFWVDLPAHASARGSQPERAPSPEPPRALTDGQSRRVVLYVEDNPANVTFMRDLLDSFEKVELIAVPTAEIGVELARAQQPDVIILDINLPGMSGIDALHALRAAPETRHIPVIALSAAASERDKQRGVLAGFYRYLTKPVKVDEILAVLEGALAARG